MKTLVFASNNLHKLFEIRNVIGSQLRILGLKDLNINVEIPEDHDTLHENALQKARYISQLTGMNCFADDTGLLIEALHGNPGVRSARYAGPENDARKNIEKVLAEMAGKENRRAAFITVIALIWEGKEYLFEGRMEGEILFEPQGDHGFGYDPIFKPDGYEKSYAQMSMEEKNQISHRAIAVRKLRDFLQSVEKQK